MAAQAPKWQGAEARSTWQLIDEMLVAEDEMQTGAEQAPITARDFDGA